MTLTDIMVHYDDPSRSATPQTASPLCPKCGSHRTEVIGSTDLPRTDVVRCNACGERSIVPADPPSQAARRDEGADVTTELDVMQAVGRALTQLPDDEARRRVLRWINDRFQPSAARFDDDTPGGPHPSVDSTLGIDGLSEFFERPGLEPIMHAEAVDLDLGLEPEAAPEQPQLESLVRGFVNDFQRIALEWQSVSVA
jgi:hypothetical protein